MKREILFRAKRKDNNQWVEGYYFIDLENKLPYIMLKERNGTTEDWMIKAVEILPDTLSQFTGLLDKNGTKIFEGDHLRIKGTMEDNKYEYDCIYVVNRMNHEGVSLRFDRLAHEEPDSFSNSYPIAQNPAFKYGILGIDARNNKCDNLAINDSWGENHNARTNWKEMDYTNDIEVITELLTSTQNK